MGNRRVERRKFIRFDFDANVKFKVSENADVSENINGKAKDLSGEGVCIVTEKELPREKDIQLDIFLPGKKAPIRVQGKVIWTQRIKSADKNTSDHFENGIKIYVVDKNDENTLLKYYCERMVDNLSKYLHL